MNISIVYKIIITGVIVFVITPVLLFAGQFGNWSIINNLNISRAGNVAVLAQDTIIYTFGGYSYTITPYPVERAIILSNGNLSNWSIDSQTMISARNSGLGFYDNGYIYAISGDAGSGLGFSTTVERSQINFDGTLSPWTTISFLPRGFYSSSLIQTSTYVYIIGGYDGSPDIFRSTINPDGTLGTWTLLSSKLNGGRSSHMSILIDSTIYVQGGLGISGFSNTVEYATLFPDGELSAFITSTSNPIAIHAIGGLFYDGQYLNVVGGYYSGAYNYRSERAMINSDGSLGPWEPAPALQVERSGFGFVQTNTTAYVIGGWNGSDLPTVEYAPILGVTGIERREWEIFE